MLREHERTPETERALRRLIEDQLLSSDGAGAPRTTRKLQSALARAALREYGSSDEFDLRVPLASALVELYGLALPDEELVAMIDALLPIEAAELDPRTHLAPRDDDRGSAGGGTRSGDR